jgi:hypothetical protein
MDKSQIETTNDMKIAILTQNDYVRKITMEYDQFMTGSNWKTKIFETIETAKAWVDS